MPAPPTLEEVLHDLENFEFISNAASAITTLPAALNFTFPRLRLDSGIPLIRLSDPFWCDFMQNLKDLERMRIIEDEVCKIRSKLSLEKEETANQSEQLQKTLTTQLSTVSNVEKE